MTIISSPRTRAAEAAAYGRRYRPAFMRPTQLWERDPLDQGFYPYTGRHALDDEHETRQTTVRFVQLADGPRKIRVFR